jgi:hypothetical protein
MRSFPGLAPNVCARRDLHAGYENDLWNLTNERPPDLRGYQLERRRDRVVLLQWLTTADIQKAMPLRAPTPAIANSHACPVSTVTEATLIAI